MQDIRKLAILIFHPGEGEHALTGVEHDAQNMYNFLLSPRGGGWRLEEVVVLWKGSRREILRIVQAAEADYLFVYYSGHGAGQLTPVWEGDVWHFVDERWLEMGPNRFMQDLALINGTVLRQLIVCDCCRNRPSARIGGIPEVLEEIPYTDQEVEIARRRFDSSIWSSPAGCTIVHSTSDGQLSWDSSDGGVFTGAFLRRALEWRAGYPFSGLSVEDMVMYLSDVLGKRRRPQVPEITYKIGALTVPVVLNTPWPSRTPARVRSVYSPERTVFSDVRPSASPQINGWVALGGIALGLLLLRELE
ncbi:MAG: caspase family protein [Bacteroidota bacterium]